LLNSSVKSVTKSVANLPLSGRTILITRAAGQSSNFSNFSDRLQQEGATVIEMPALVITPPSTWEPLDNAILNISNFNWLILTSSNGVDYFFERLTAKGKDSKDLAELKIAVVGKKTAQSLKKRSLEPDFIPPNFVADSLVAHFPGNLEGSKILFPRVETGGRDVLVKELTEKGAEVTEVPAYESGCPTEIAADALTALQQKTIDVITFASSKTVKNFCQLIESNKQQLPQNLLEGICIASIGPQTSESCQSLLGRVDVEAKEYTLDGLTEAIIRRIAEAGKRQEVKGKS
jgi:uroporphyrinogen III methyltransferase/synthase